MPQKETRKYSNHPFFRGELLNFGGVVYHQNSSPFATELRLKKEMDHLSNPKVSGAVAVQFSSGA